MVYVIAGISESQSRDSGREGPRRLAVFPGLGVCVG